MISRRTFLSAVAGGVLTAALGAPERAEGSMKTRVSLVKTPERERGIKRAVGLLGINPVRGKHVLLKPNFNTADPYPGGTHNDTLRHLILKLRGMGAKSITVGERSGPPDTAEVIREMGVDTLLRELGVGLINFEELPPEGWVRMKPEGSHWKRGFDVAKPVLDSECVVSTCCLKTHRFGGVFTMSLKLSVGITHKRNMSELHTSFLSMRKMIAEINQVYTPRLIVLDGIEAFTDGGPMTGTRKRADVLLAGTDRVAIDAVGLAVLKELGSNEAIMEKKIFAQEQIARAVELGLGAKGPEDIEIITDDEKSNAYARRIGGILREG
jgi:uncharacterized protein (DUF362 family)